jgi:hypothetical protein
VLNTADFDVASFENSAQAEEDKKLLVKFFVKAMPDKAASLAEGRPIFRDAELIDIKIPGDRTGGVCRPASFQDRQRFAAHYAAFKQRVEMPTVGTPLIEWPLITRSLAEELAFHNVKTVEHLSTMSDTHSSKFMGLNALKAKALKWLEQSGEEAKVHELQQQLLERDERIALQGGQIGQLQEQMLALMGDKKQPDWPASPPAMQQDPAPVAAAPLLSSELDNPIETVGEPESELVVTAPVKKTRRRRTKAADDGTIQDDK